MVGGQKKAYTLVRHSQEGTQRLGAYCTAECLYEHLPRLMGIEINLAGKPTS
jgi:hypothetical protein